MSAPYMLGRVWDPLYAIAIGAGAAVVRVRREEKEKGHSMEQTVENLKRRVNMMLEKPEEAAKAVKSGS